MTTVPQVAGAKRAGTAGSAAGAPAPAGPGAGGSPSRAARGLSLVERSAVVGSFVIMVLLFCLLAGDTFPTSGTVKDILDQCAVPVILVCGLTLVLAVGEFDLSYTATVGLAAGLVIVLTAQHGWSVGPAILVSLLASLAVGVIVGLLVTVGRASSFIVTLAIGSAVTGLELAITGNKTIFQNIPVNYADLSAKTLLGLKSPVWAALLIMGAIAVLLHRTRFGRQAQAIGGNPTAAYLAGVRVRRIRVIAFAIVAVLAGVAAIILTSRASSYYPNSSAGFLLNTYAAAFLGASVGRWRGFTVFGSAFGVLWITTLQTGLTQANAPAWTSSFIQGLVLAIAVLVASRGRQATS
ncbi:ABC transporter permease [Paraconexibacter antarcticus]|uniref:ABC transporter permease n=1 Tax=Paraconexibacter antarcticus TaxID=2949664 RepID=A0ABY5DLJ9_9ACTN|nr:ABC transporter permease [Paraconexibacter antarcticus]UTI62344.1 ABC transporter permease [Paraconexibacter antarcticus]